jgi:hypothetical protein
MFQKLVSHNNDIQRLVEKGYAVGFDSNCMVVRDISYLDAKGDLKWGAFVTKLVFTDNEHVTQEDHQIWFAGSHPYNVDGTAIANLGGGETTVALSKAAEDIKIERSFSNKPRIDGELKPFANFFDKIESYAGIICGPAKAKFGAAANPLTFGSMEAVHDQSVFKIHDTLTSRAEISDLSMLFKDEVVAIIGLGGSGGYLLDFMVKTPVREIRGFDRDPFHVHNVFRAPGKFEESELRKSKADIYQVRYDNFRTGLNLKAKFIDATCGEDLDGVTFAFVCVDKGSSRAGIFELLFAKRIPFIDVGLGLNRKHGPLCGMLRVTYYPSDLAQKVKKKALSELSDRPADEYRRNIQLGEFNAMNAALAVMRYKQVKGFYLDETASYHTLFEVRDLSITSRPISSLLDET